jgi:GNAT superfamily N-acetyltransferase
VTVPLDVLPDRLVAHLTGWTGAWPPTLPPTVVGNARNAAPGWDGRLHPVTGVIDRDGAAVIGVPAGQAALVLDAIEQQSLDLPSLLRELPRLLGRPRHRVYTGVFRWTTTPADLPDVGEWVDADDPVVPTWLHPFGGQVLIARDPAGAYLAGVGIKRHDAHGHELSVGTEPAARGSGLARRLVAQAARRVLADGKVPTYLHDPANIASARVADAAGFPDLGWRVLGMFEPEAPEAPPS